MLLRARIEAAVDAGWHDPLAVLASRSHHEGGLRSKMATNDRALSHTDGGKARGVDSDGAAKKKVPESLERGS